MRKQTTIGLLFILFTLCFAQKGKTSNCGPSTKRLADGSCGFLSDEDVLTGLHDLVYPPTASCRKTTTAQGITVCEDPLPARGDKCVVWSVLASQWCDHLGSLDFEKVWSERGCDVTVFHFMPYFKGNKCSIASGQLPSHPRIKIVRSDIWKERCFACWYKLIPRHLGEFDQVDILKIQMREGVKEDFDGLQTVVLADLFTHLPSLAGRLRQIVWLLSINTNTLIDTVGREAEMAWNFWAASRFLQGYGAVSSEALEGPKQLRPVQFFHLLDQANVSTSYSFYRQSYMWMGKEFSSGKAWQAKVSAPLVAQVPGYCRLPSAQANDEMQRWIRKELSVRCHPTRLWVPCDRSRPYLPLLPCEQELMDKLAEDYAIMLGWCDFTHRAAAIPALELVTDKAQKAFRKPPLPREQGVRLAFFFTVYTDADHVRRLLARLYSPRHYYLFHLDAGSEDQAFAEAMEDLARAHPNNVFLVREIPIVYGASTASEVLTRALAFFARRATGWDYVVAVTGSDYPLVPLARLEHMLAYQQPPMPFVMAWTPGTSTHIFRLQKTHEVFEQNNFIARSIKAVTAERGAVLGAVPMEYRSNNFGPPLLCRGGGSFYHLDNRVNKSGRALDTQWLFPRDVFPGRGRAYAEENPAFATPSFDKVWRVWKKSDPATTGIFDKASVLYITESEEGRKYYHYFKHMLLGSEEHYYVSLLYNWPRTRSFVQSLSSQAVWNTWELGLWETSAGGFQTHTHFLSMEEWDILRGFSLRGMVFARKFSTKKTGPLLDRIDRELLLVGEKEQSLEPSDQTKNGTLTIEAGQYWPGYFEVDTTTPGRQWVANFRRNQRLKRKNQTNTTSSGGVGGRNNRKVRNVAANTV